MLYVIMVALLSLVGITDSSISTKGFCIDNKTDKPLVFMNKDYSNPTEFLPEQKICASVLVDTEHTRNIYGNTFKVASVYGELDLTMSTEHPPTLVTIKVNEEGKLAMEQCYNND